jgi:hypothetical protein
MLSLTFTKTLFFYKTIPTLPNKKSPIYEKNPNCQKKTFIPISNNNKTITPIL